MPGCIQPIVKCTSILENGKMCKHNGHPDYYKCSDTELMAEVKHAHFVNDLDIGRNLFHGIKRVAAPRSVKVVTWRTPRGKDRWNKIPKAVKRSLGWDQ
jgi:hypothetical protein